MKYVGYTKKLVRIKALKLGVLVSSSSIFLRSHKLITFSTLGEGERQNGTMRHIGMRAGV